MKARHFELAAKTAKKSSSKFRLGAVLARRTKVISVGWNDMSRTHPITKKFNNGSPWVSGIHAEMDACLDADRNELVGAEIYIVRVRKDGTKGLAKPCFICSKMLKSMGIYVAYYSTEDGYGECYL